VAISSNQEVSFDRLELRQVQQVLAVSGVFDPMLEVLSAHIEEISTQCEEHVQLNSYHWILKGDERAAALRAINSAEELKEIIAKADLMGLQPKRFDLFGVALREALESRTLESLSRTALKMPFGKDADAVRLALQFAMDIPALGDVRRKRIKDITRDLSAALGLGSQTTSIEALVPSRLYGRGEAVREIERYIFRKSGSATSVEGRSEPMLISGQPGIGKSTLLAWIMLRLRRERAGNRRNGKVSDVYVVHLDFDSPLLAHASEVEITMEFYKQLIWSLRTSGQNEATIAFAERLEGERRELSSMSGGGRSSLESASGGSWSDSIVNMLSNWSEAVGNSARIAVFADTLEILDQLGKGSHWLWRGWFGIVREMVPNASLIMSSRASLVHEMDTDATHAAIQETRLGPLPAGSAAWLFLDLRQRRRKQAGFGFEPVIYEVGRLAAEIAHYDPLMLVILVGHRLDLDYPEFRIELEALAVEHPSAHQASIHSLLYARILDRLPPQLREVAHPGLLLPEINAEFLVNVILAHKPDAPISAPKITLTAARDLIQELALSTWLVGQSVGGRPFQDFRHRSDIRERIVPAMLADKREEIVQILNAAADYLELALNQGNPEIGSYEAHLAKDPERTNALIHIIRLIAGRLPEPEALRAFATPIIKHWPNELGLLPIGLRACVLGAAGKVGLLSEAEIMEIPESFESLRREFLAGKRATDLRRGKKASPNIRELAKSNAGLPKLDQAPALALSAMSEIELEAEISAAFLTGDDHKGALYWQELVWRLPGLGRTPSQSRADWLKLESRSWDFWQSPFWLGALCARLGKETKILDQVVELTKRALADPGRLLKVAIEQPFRPLIYLLLFCALHRGNPQELKSMVWRYCEVFGSNIWRELGASSIDSRTFLLLAPFKIGERATWSQRFTTQLCALGDVGIAKSFFAAFDMSYDKQVESTFNEGPKHSLREIERRHNITISTKSSALPEGPGLIGLRGTSPEVRALLNEAVTSSQPAALDLLQNYAASIQGFPEELLGPNQAPQMAVSEVLVALDRFGRLKEAIDCLHPLIGTGVERALVLLKEVDVSLIADLEAR